MNTKNWFLEKIRYYCGIEIYTKFYNLSDEEMAIEIISRQADIDPEGIADLFGDENFGYQNYSDENDWKLVEAIEMIRRKQVDIDTGDITKLLGYKKYWKLLKKDYILEVDTEDKTEKKYHKKYFIQTVEQLFDISFFAEYRYLSDDALMLEILCLSMDDGRQPKRLFLEASYGEMIRLDSTRVIYRALDVLYGDSGPNYTFENLLHTLGDLSRISRSKFIPQNIIEIEKRVIQFNLYGKLYTLEFKGEVDDPFMIAVQINSIIVGTGYQFEFYCPEYYNELAIITLSEEEKKKMIKKKLWDWNDYDFEHCFEFGKNHMHTLLFELEHGL
ncbi:hypothetical protein [Roseofilum sp. Guam]|uniref:hypothetical protein n=1 Tax=Roseofilum sp. Guam TaxID=2821502 RepID=UPI001B1379F8|nr:hypothetical protein [Roseofilum sp. Guam]MBP0029166.1 hypothetical protein [Roseofilum sp. Guam]